ncbi:PAS domain-containing protein [Sneathiella sp.]|uniref:PAS domain-containing protein n=1 Tax=Sneathiella sp. TaxID=1964365 RepID=UPI00356999AC
MQKFTTAMDDIKHPCLIDLVNYWKKMKTTSGIPLRSQFNPVDIPQCLRHVVLIDVIPSNPRFYIRLAGSAAVSVYTFSVPGKYVEDLLAEKDLAEVIPQYEHSLTHHVPTYLDSTLTVPSGKRLHYERVVLPLSSDGKHADKLLNGLHYFDVKQQLMDRPILKML